MLYEQYTAVLKLKLKLKSIILREKEKSMQIIMKNINF